MPPATDLAEALKGAGMEQFVPLFTAKGYKAVTDLGATETAAQASIESVLGGDRGGYVQRVLRLWGEATKPVVVVEPAKPCELTDTLTTAGFGDLAKRFTDQGWLAVVDLGSDEKSALDNIKSVIGKDKPGAVTPILGLWRTAFEKATPSPSLSSPVAKALVGAGLRELATALSTQGYYDWKSLGADAKTVGETVKTVSPTSSSGDVQRVVGLWQSNQPVARTPLEIPKLPAGTTADLTLETVTVGDVTYKLPTELAVNKSDKDYKKAFELTDVEWIVLAKQTRMLYGLDVNSCYQEPEQVDKVTTRSRAVVGEPAFVWSVPASDTYLDSRPVSDVGSLLSYTRALSNLVDSQVMSGKIEIGTPFVSAAAEASRKERQASAATTKTLRATGWYFYQHAKLDVDKCTELSKGFVARIDSALEKASPQDKLDALKKVFADYGHVYARSVRLGGQAVYEHSEVITSTTTQNTVESDVKAAITAKYGPGLLSASGESGSGHKDKGEAESQVKLDRFRCVGGESTLASKPADWAPSTLDPRKWQVIFREDLAPLVDRLDDGTPAGAERRRRVGEVWDQYLNKLWGGRRSPEYYVLPDFEGAPLSMWTTQGTERGITPTGLVGGLATLSPSNLKADAGSHGLTWELVYSGKSTEGLDKDGKTLRGLPIYFIVEYQTASVRDARGHDTARALAKNKSIRDATGMPYDGPVPVPRVMLAAVPGTGGTSKAGCLEWPADSTALVNGAETSAGAWTLEPADADDSGRYVVKNVLTKGFLGLGQPTDDAVSIVVAPAQTPGTVWQTPVWQCLTHPRQ